MSAHRESGFTIVELMVVVLIIGILIGVAIPLFNAPAATTRQRACQANLRTLDGAVEQWSAASPTNNAGSLDSLLAAQGAIGAYVKDWAQASECPAGGVYVVTDGAFSCPNGHAY